MKYIPVAIGLLAIVVAVAVSLHRRPHALKLTGAERPFAPEFSIRALDGSTIDLKTYRGKVVLLDFWATWCEPCRTEIPRFIQLQDRYRSHGFQVIGISMDDGPEPVRQFYDEFKMNYPVALGGAKLGELYGGVLGLPICFVIARDGRIHSKHIGPVDPSVLQQEITHLLVPAGDGTGS